jgi:hypothetical protein
MLLNRSSRGVTNLADAFILHEALESQGMNFPFEALTAMPEPIASALLVFASLLAAAMTRLA